MRPLVITGRLSPANVALLRSCRGLGVGAQLLPPDVAAARAPATAIILGRVDVLPSVDGIEPGLNELRSLERRGLRVLNGAETLRAAHDKRRTAHVLEAAGLSHPRTWSVRLGEAVPDFERPVVVKPRFGSWGEDVVRCDTPRALERTLESLRRRPWFRRQGALVQELVPPVGEDLRIVVAGGMVVGAIRRVAKAGEWRTNVALGARRVPIEPPLGARVLAVEAAAAIGADLVGVDLLPTDEGYTILELNGCVDFTSEYSLEGGDVHSEAVGALLARASCSGEPWAGAAPTGGWGSGPAPRRGQTSLA
ncbi:MAG TPA: ATP-grasp domain-containing protein [Gaiellaceae bacterium]|jgi:RimK family alpha-L-glutamate ligase|nr:ATP-grasp domain-containing protein [Gaiellaceae bacterium]